MIEKTALRPRQNSEPFLLGEHVADESLINMKLLVAHPQFTLETLDTFLDPLTIEGARTLDQRQKLLVAVDIGGNGEEVRGLIGHFAGHAEFGHVEIRPASACRHAPP